jgi:hypothetical protein
MVRGTRALIATFALLATVGGARADTYYVVVFGAESRPMRPKFSHSWATFIRVPGDCPCRPPAVEESLEWFTISWMPYKIELTPNRLLPEPGTNLDLTATFDAVLSHCEHIATFGPYQIDDWLYCRAKGFLRELQSGAVRYKTIDTGYKPLKASNCIHALTSFDREHVRVRIGRTNFGEVASYFVTETYRPHIIGPGQVHCWIADLLGLGRYPIQWRTLDDGRPHPRTED